jgi:hypothetical protein
MSIRLDRGVIETSHELKSPVTARKAYTAPWILRTEDPGEVDLTQIGGTLNRQPTDSFILSEVNNVYRSTSIDAKYYPSSLRALKAVFTSKETWALNSSTGNVEASTVERHYPISASVTITVPTSLPLNEEDETSQKAVSAILQDFLNSVVGTASERLISQLYGALDARQDELKEG